MVVARDDRDISRFADSACPAHGSRAICANLEAMVDLRGPHPHMSCPRPVNSGDRRRPGAAERGASAFSPRRKTHERAYRDVLSRSSAPRHRGLPPHDRAAVRGPREIGPRAGRGDAGRQTDPAVEPDRPRGRRSRRRRDLSRGRPCQRAAAPQAARRHREGAGRGQEPGAHHRISRERPLLRSPRRSADRNAGRCSHGGGAGALGRRRVRALRQGQEEHPRRGACRRFGHA